jgi:hypothetical protein
MENKMKIWRYMPLSHYVNMVASSKMYVPLTKRLSDPMEGTWFSETENKLTRERIPYLEHKIFLRDKSRDLNEKEFRTFYHEYGSGFYEQLELEGDGPVKEFLENKKSFEAIRQYFTEQAEECPEEIAYCKRILSTNKEHLGMVKEMTFVSSWSKSEEQNIAMWKLFGHGDDTIAITTTVEKLIGVVEKNKPLLDQMGYSGDVSEVNYIEKIHNPSITNLTKMYEIMNKVQWSHVASLLVKPRPYQYENEVRLIIFPLVGAYLKKMDHVELDIDMNYGGFEELLSGGNEGFIEEIYLPPNLTTESPQYKAITHINENFGIPNWKLKIDRIEINGKSKEDA